MKSKYPKSLHGVLFQLWDVSMALSNARDDKTLGKIQRSRLAWIKTRLGQASSDLKDIIGPGGEDDR